MSEYATIEYCVNHVMAEITKRDVEQVSENLRALGWEEVVRCRDCKYYGYGKYATHCYRFVHKVEPDGFCAWGERRSE